MVAKFWLNPVRLVSGGGFPEPELRRIESIIMDRVRELLESWNEFFAN